MFLGFCLLALVLRHLRIYISTMGIWFPFFGFFICILFLNILFLWEFSLLYDGNHQATIGSLECIWLNSLWLLQIILWEWRGLISCWARLPLCKSHSPCELFCQENEEFIWGTWNDQLWVSVCFFSVRSSFCGTHFGVITGLSVENRIHTPTEKMLMVLSNFLGMLEYSVPLRFLTQTWWLSLLSAPLN